MAHPGTYLGLIEKIPYLQSLGITTVELLPLLEFDETENFRRNPVTGERLLNYWGYSPVSFFAPKASFAAEWTPGAGQDDCGGTVQADPGGAAGRVHVGGHLDGDALADPDHGDVLACGDQQQMEHAALDPEAVDQ